MCVRLMCLSHVIIPVMLSYAGQKPIESLAIDFFFS